MTEAPPKRAGPQRRRGSWGGGSSQLQPTAQHYPCQRIPANPSPTEQRVIYPRRTKQGGYTMHRTTILLAAVLLASTAACTSGDDSDPKPSASASSSAGGRLSAEWKIKLDNATDPSAGVCNQVGDEECAEHLTDIALVVGELETAIGEAGGADAYPRAMARIESINFAVEGYTDHQCLGDVNANIAGSPCPDDARTIMTGGEMLHLALENDEAHNG